MSDMADIEEAIRAYREGEILIVTDDEDRENEGDFIVAAERTTPEAINFMLKHGRGILCMPMTEDRLQDLGLSMMVDRNTARHTTPFTVSIDARHGTSTGASAGG